MQPGAAALPPLPAAAVVGATGLVGRFLVGALSASPRWGSIRVLVRHPLPADLDLPGVDTRERPTVLWGDPTNFAGTHTLFCLLGTTLRKAGGAEAFRDVDLRLVESVAEGAAAAGVPHLQVVSSAGANASSRLLYPRTKGEMETAVGALPFTSVLILRPSLLLGPRNENRPGERVAAALLRPLSPLLRGPLAAIRPIEAALVARAMVRWAREPRPGVTILESPEIRTLAAG
jgi:uncharacterized protein YbjT (DUF2867 family)